MRPRTAAVTVIKHTRRVIAGPVSVWTSFVYVAFHTAGVARFADWAAASGVLIPCAANQALCLIRTQSYGGKDTGGTNNLMGTIPGFVIALLATVFTDKSSLGINFAGIMEITRNSDLSFSGLVYIVAGARREIYTHYDRHRRLGNQ